MGPSFYIALLSPLERFGQYVHSFEEMQQCFVAQSMDEVDDAVSTKEMLSEVVTRLQHLLVEGLDPHFSVCFLTRGLTMS